MAKKYFDVIPPAPSLIDSDQAAPVTAVEFESASVPSIEAPPRPRTLRVKKRRLTKRNVAISVLTLLVLGAATVTLTRPDDINGTVQALTDTMQASPHDFEPSDAEAVREDWRLGIEAIDLDAPLQPIGLTAGGNVGVPSDVRYVGWYKHGPKPGEPGNAVLDGHVSVRGLGSGVFKNLNKLQPGDVIRVTESGVSQKFEVLSTESYDVASAPKEKIFGATNERRLNLITCSGKWDKDKKDYTERLVVYTRLDE